MKFFIISIIVFVSIIVISVSTIQIVKSVSKEDESIIIIFEERFPDFYAGAFVDENQEVIICVKENNNSEVLRFIQENELSIKTVEFSVNDLNQVLQTVKSLFASNTLVSSGINYRENVVMIRILKDQVVPNEVLNLINANKLLLVEVDSYPVVN